MNLENVFSHWTDKVSVSNTSEQFDLTNQSDWLKRIQNIKNDLIKLDVSTETEDIRDLLKNILRKQLFSTGFFLLGTIINKGDSEDIQKLKKLILKIKNSEKFDNTWPKTLYEIIKSKNPNIEKLAAAEKLCLNILGELFGKIHISMPQYNACSREVLEQLGYPEVHNYQDFQNSFELFKKMYAEKVGKLSENEIPINVEIDQFFNYFHKTEDDVFVDDFWKRKKSSKKYWVWSSDPKNWMIAKSENIWASKKENIAKKVKPGDCIVFYIKNPIKEFQGIYEVASEWYESDSSSLNDDKNRTTNEVKLELVTLGNIPLGEIQPKLDFLSETDKKGANFLKLQGRDGYPSNDSNPISSNDYNLILNTLKEKPYVDNISALQSSESYSNVNFWLVGSGIEKEREKRWNEFKDNNIVGVGWNKIGDVSNFSKKQIDKVFQTSGYKQGAASMLNFTKIKPNDIIFVNDGKQGFFGIGKAVGGYRFDTKYSIHHHVVPVEWFTTEYILVKPDNVPGNPNASCSRIVKDKKSLLKYLNGMPEKIEDCSEVKEFEDVLIKSKQIIFSGPPGTGKTHYADLLAKCFTKNPKSSTMTFRSAAIQILSENGKPMHYTKIWKQALNQKLVQTDGKTPQETLRTKIAEDMKRNGSTSIFKKTDIATYDINQEKLDELKIIESNESEKNPFVESVTFHPSYSYEDFIEGIKPSMTNGQISYNLEDGIFKRICEKASADSKNKYVLLIDEINRGNISKIFGELINILETSYREKPITLAYSKLPFSVPKNLHIIGTMNTADRSLVQIDAALRRRFSFIELMPKPEKLTKTIDGISLRKLLEKLNDRIVTAGLREKQVGHTYLLFVETISELQFVFSYQIVPLLQDYFFNNYDKLENEILSGHFIDSEKMIVNEKWKTNIDTFVKALKETFEL